MTLQSKFLYYYGGLSETQETLISTGREIFFYVNGNFSKLIFSLICKPHCLHVPMGCTDVCNEGRELKVRPNLKVHPKMHSSLQEKGFGEASVLPHWKPAEVSFLQAGSFHPTAVAVLMKVTTTLFSGSKCATWPF